MRDILSSIIDDSLERQLPTPIPRGVRASELPGKATVVIGMRRVGKTWLCYQRMQELLAQGVPRERLLYINFEDDRLLPFQAGDFQSILDVYFSRHPELKDVRCHFFLDEIQRVEGWELFVRRLLDTENVSVWVTGSSSRLLSREIATTLRGRALATEVFPLSFVEFLRFHGEDAPATARFGARARAMLQKRARDYLQLGGLPEVQFVDDIEIRRQILRNQVDVVLLRDIVERHAVTNLNALRRLVRHVMTSPATRFSVNKFYNTLRSQGVSCTKDSLYEYLDHLSDAYLLHQAPIRSGSEKVRQVNPRKIYVSDSGLLEADLIRRTEDRGRILENLAYTHLRRQGWHPEYVVTESGLEVDFLLPARNAEDQSLIQVCWSVQDEETLHREVRALREGMRELGQDKGKIVTWNEQGEVEPGIEVVPAYRWLLEDEPER